MTTKTEYLLDRIAERLGVPKPEGQAFSPDIPSKEAVAAFVALAADPAAVKKLGDLCAEARETIAAAKQARRDRDRLDVEIATTRKEHDEKLAQERALHNREIQTRTKNLDGREQALVAREKEADDERAELKADRAKLEKKFAAIRNAAAD